MTRYDAPRTDAGLEVNTAVVTPTDRIRWGPILAGVFAAITAAAVLSTLGTAIGLSAYDRGDDARSFAIGAGVWGAITMLIAFGLGGWLAARSAAFRGRGNAMLNGAMVAGVGIPLLMFLLGAAGTVVGRQAAQGGQDRVQAGGGLQGAFDNAVQAGASVSAGEAPAARDQAVQSEEAADTGSRAAWGTLIALLLAIGAAAAGGYLGARDTDDGNRVATA